MEIPAIKLELCQQDRKEFSRQLDEALGTVRVAQISGLEQRLVDGFYDKMREYYGQSNNFKGASNPNYVGRGFYRESFHQKGHITPLATPELSQSIERIRQNISLIVRQVNQAMMERYGLPSLLFGALTVRRYFEGPKMISPHNNRKNMVAMHYDGTTLTFISSSAPGLEGQIEGCWTPLQPEKGHLLVWAGKSLPPQCNVKPLRHRVSFPDSERYSIIYY